MSDAMEILKLRAKVKRRETTIRLLDKEYREQQRQIATLRDALQYAVEKYGKPGGPWNVPGDPGGWLDRARKALEATE